MQAAQLAEIQARVAQLEADQTPKPATQVLGREGIKGTTTEAVKPIKVHALTTPYQHNFDARNMHHSTISTLQRDFPQLFHHLLSFYMLQASERNSTLPPCHLLGIRGYRPHRCRRNAMRTHLILLPCIVGNGMDVAVAAGVIEGCIRDRGRPQAWRAQEAASDAGRG